MQVSETRSKVAAATILICQALTIGLPLGSAPGLVKKSSMHSSVMYEEDRSVVLTPVVKVLRWVFPKVFEQVQPAEGGMGKDHLVRIGGPNVPSRLEGCGCGRGSRKQGGPLLLEHGLVVEEQDIEVPAMLVQQEQGYQNVLATKSPKVVGREDPQEDRTGERSLPMSSKFRVQIGQLQ